MKRTTGVLLFATGASAFYAGNINYFSPSLHHPSLGISIPKVAARTYASSPWKPEQLNFTHGVASGDPYDDSVILWTRAAPTMDNDHSNTTVSGTTGLFSHETEEFVKLSKATVCVDWKIAEDKEFEMVADEGRVWTSSDIDFTVKVRTIDCDEKGSGERADKMEIGRGEETLPFYYLLLPVQYLRFEQELACWEDQDTACQGKESSEGYQAGCVLVQQLS